MTCLLPIVNDTSNAVQSKYKAYTAKQHRSKQLESNKLTFAPARVGNVKIINASNYNNYSKGP